jgi:hypothetical protein
MEKPSNISELVAPAANIATSAATVKIIEAED